MGKKPETTRAVLVIPEILPGPGRPSTYNPIFCDELIEHMADGYSFESFAGRLGCCKQTLYNWADKHPEFMDAKNIGTEASRYFWERAGIQGLWSDKDSRFNSTIWIFAMKNRFGWRDRQDFAIDQGSEDDEADFELLRSVPREALKQLARKKKEGESA